MKFQSLINNRKKEIIDFTRKMIQIPSVNGNETAVCTLIAKKLVQYGIKSKLVGQDKKRLNLLAKISERKGKTLLFAGHTDTVAEGQKSKWHYPPFSGKLVKGKLFGRGAADMKAGLAAIVLSAIVLKESRLKLNGQILLAFTANEENPQKQETGIQYLLRKGLIKADAAVITEPSRLSLSIGSRGVYRFTITTLGKSWHTGRISEKGINAVTKMAKVLLALEKLQLSFKKHPLFPTPKITPGTVIAGGQSINIVPDQCKAQVDCRLSFGQTHQSAKNDVNQLIKKLKKEDPQLNIKLKEVFYAPPAVTKANHPFVRLIQKNTKQVTKQEPKIKVSGPIGDNNFLISAGMPTVLCGPDGENFHTENEFVDLNSIFSVTKVLTSTALEYLGGQGLSLEKDSPLF